jgi:Transposase
MWYVGLDWADTHHDVEVPYLAGKRVGARRFPHSHEGLNELKQFVVTAQVRWGLAKRCQTQ